MRTQNASRRTFQWRCWYEGNLINVVVEPPAREEKNAAIGGVPGRIYERCGTGLRTIAGVVKQDGDGKTYFVRNGV
jgi:hypothetical protein